MEDRCAHPEKYLISMYKMLKEIEARNETLAAATDEVKTEPTRTWVYEVCRRLPEWQQLGRRRLKQGDHISSEFSEQGKASYGISVQF